MKLIIGLGNPGKKYEATKHNIGFIAIEEMAHQMGLSFNKTKFESNYAEGFIGSEKIILIKPQTFMNESGRSVRPWMDFYDLYSDEIIVLYDDMDLPPGKIRLRPQGSSGGHNGIKSIINHIGTKEFNRIKIGIGRPYEGQDVVSHVISRFSKDVYQDMLHGVEDTVKAVEDWIESNDFVNTMNKYN